uniref:Leukotriene A(4) hydrolase n=1 Tax=Hemiscolopendra marginata TaxID=943146 RepID=A0A646QDM6_9MYRI
MADDKKSLGLSPGDPNSFSRPDQWIVTNLHLKIDVDFKKEILHGHVILTVEKKENDSDHLLLDTRNLTIHEVVDVKDSKPLSFEMFEPYKTFGSKLQITLPKNGEKTVSIRVAYQTSSQSSALQWLPPQQTAGKKHPYLFSQNQAIHARSMLPCQDTPSVKAPFTAEVSAPSDLTVLMSALREDPIVDPEDSKKKIHHFKQPVGIPSYLIALVVGALESRQIGPRSYVWSEKELVNAAAEEFSETETMIKAGENVMGPYIWNRYDILVLPPSFPFGGMENPCLTFVTPTLLAGDKSLASVIAHEIAHSWTGNLVTNKNFEHFWLNEGFTVFAERKIIGRMLGEAHRHFHAIIGWKDLQESIKTQGADNPLTSLVVNLKDVDPDDAFSTVPYEKGHSLLFYLEHLVGGPGKFEPFFRDYINKFKHQSIDTQTWKEYFENYFKEKVPEKTLASIDWKTWLYKPGMPPVDLKFDNSLAESSQKLSERWINASTEHLSSFGSSDIKQLTSMQICEFLSLLLQTENFSLEKLKAMQKAYNFSEIRNSEIKFRWIRLGIKSRWTDSIPLALKFVTEQGRMKFVRPIYRDLYSWEDARQKAIDNYNSTRSQMMYVTSAMVAKDLHLKAT